MTEADIPQSTVVTRQETSGPEWDPIITDVPYSCTGWIDTYDTAERANGDVLVNDRKVFIVASTLSITPAPGNTVSVNGGATFSIITVQLDPAGAAWLLQCRV